MKKIIYLLLLLLTCQFIHAKKFELRLLNHWDNPDGTIERGYAGRSIWKWEENQVRLKLKELW
ncbi:MAG: hypothetical protein Q4P12_00975, partial [Bacteroidales bacterium]|nr:hypothetical protein [Bacteroidales bacterium]